MKLPARALLIISFLLLFSFSVFGQARTASQLQLSTVSNLNVGNPPNFSTRGVVNGVPNTLPCQAAAVGATTVGALGIKLQGVWVCLPKTASGGVGGSVLSFNLRTGVVTSATNDYTWAQIDKAVSSLADLQTRSAADLNSGILADARFPATLPAVSGVNLTNLNGSNIASGTVPDARLSANVTQLGSTITEAEITLADNTTNDVGPTKHGLAPKGDGSLIKFLNANGGYSTPAGTGDASTNTVTSVADELPLFLDTLGKTFKRATGTGFAFLTSGVLSTVSATGTGNVVRAVSPALTTPTGIVKGDVGLGNVDNTSDATKNAAAVTITNHAFNGSSNTFTNLPAAGILGVIPIANLATGTPDGTKFVRDDGTLAVPAGGAGGTGDVTSNTVSSVDGEAAVFNSTTGKQIRRFTLTGLVKSTSGVLSAAASGTDYELPLTFNSPLTRSTNAISCATCGVTGTGLQQFASTTSAQFFGIISNETGSGAVVGGTAPTITNAVLTTPFVTDLTNMTHTHTSTSSGGTLDAAAIGSGTINAARLPTTINAANIADGTVSSAEFQFINSLTSNAQTQIDSKQATLTNSAGLMSALSDETGGAAGGLAVFSKSPTIETPTIASLTNAQHTHTNAAGGGQLTDAALSAAVTVPKGGLGLTTITANKLVKGNGASTAVVTNVDVDGSNNIVTPGSVTADQFIGSGSGASIGTGTATNTDLAGQLTLSGGGTATYTYAGTYTSAPIVILTVVGGAPTIVPRVSASSNTAFTVTGDASANINYIVIIRN